MKTRLFFMRASLLGCLFAFPFSGAYSSEEQAEINPFERDFQSVFAQSSGYPGAIDSDKQKAPSQSGSGFVEETLTQEQTQAQRLASDCINNLSQMFDKNNVALIMARFFSQRNSLPCPEGFGGLPCDHIENLSAGILFLTGISIFFPEDATTSILVSENDDNKSCSSVHLLNYGFLNSFIKSIGLSNEKISHLHIQKLFHQCFGSGSTFYDRKDDFGFRGLEKRLNDASIQIIDRIFAKSIISSAKYLKSFGKEADRNVLLQEVKEKYPQALEGLKNYFERGSESDVSQLMSSISLEFGGGDSKWMEQVFRNAKVLTPDFLNHLIKKDSTVDLSADDKFCLAYHLSVFQALNDVLEEYEDNILRTPFGKPFIGLFIEVIFFNAVKTYDNIIKSPEIENALDLNATLNFIIGENPGLKPYKDYIGQILKNADDYAENS